MNCILSKHLLCQLESQPCENCGLYQLHTKTMNFIEAGLGEGELIAPDDFEKVSN